MPPIVAARLEDDQTRTPERGACFQAALSLVAASRFARAAAMWSSDGAEPVTLAIIVRECAAICGYPDDDDAPYETEAALVRLGLTPDEAAATVGTDAYARVVRRAETITDAAYAEQVKVIRRG